MNPEYVEAPQWASEEVWTDYKSVFLAGGITDAPDWQKQMRKLLTQNRVAVVNPRRAGKFRRSKSGHGLGLIPPTNQMGTRAHEEGGRDPVLVPLSGTLRHHSL